MFGPILMNLGKSKDSLKQGKWYNFLGFLFPEPLYLLNFFYQLSSYSMDYYFKLCFRIFQQKSKILNFVFLYVFQCNISLNN